ncbi:MAG: beta-N-acetylhexosaminidase [Clostridia bacterium]|nr:beta-N-acetylhexosaminidase [Clostridia bacterium]
MSYCFSKLPEELLTGARALLPMLELSESENGIPVYAEQKEGDPSLEKTAKKVVITYHKKVQFFRMLSFLESTLIGDTYTEHPRHTNLCYMADQSRNAVFNIPTAQRMVRSLALLGFDELQLYTEDTYELEKYPYFGHMRGRWSKQELKDIVAYGEQFGVTLVPCIQTLAHLERIFHWPVFKSVLDRGSVLLVDEEKTYELIEEMFKTCAECFKCRKINIGMDEAWALGTGAFFKRNGHVPHTEIMHRHLKRVAEIAKKYGFKPMMWSDMYFRATFGGYYVTEGEFPQEVLDGVHPDVTLVYWDYYTTDRAAFDHMVKLHRSFKNPTAFAGGCQKWDDFVASNKATKVIEPMHIDACLEHGITDIWTTGWGDNGAEAAHFSILPGLALYAEKCYKADMTDEWLSTRFEELFKVSMEAFDLMSDMSYPDRTAEELKAQAHFCKELLFSDILYGLYNKHIDRDRYLNHYTAIAEGLKKYAENKNFGYLIDPIQKLAEVCAMKATLPIDIRTAYENGDKAALKQIAEKQIPTCIAKVDTFLKAQVAMWKTESRNFGIEVQQIRLGGLKERMAGIADILMDYVNGKAERIEELEQPQLWLDGRSNDSALPQQTTWQKSWDTISSVNIL